MFRGKFINTKVLSVVISFLFLAILFPSLIFARYKQFEINSPYWYIWFDRAGYVDITYWHPSERHLFGPHEMMTGDWAAAVWYDGINDGNDQAQWLTDAFIYPTFDTTQIFNLLEHAHHVENDPCNPVWTDPCQPTPPPYNPAEKYDSGWSKIDDNKLLVTIHYEVVDLGEYGYSPLAFRDSNGTPAFAYSERYVLLQTYVFENIHATQDIEDLEFYQMLHGHPLGIYNPTLLSKCVYENTAFYDPLANYTPYDPNHTVGNFSYDITIWNLEKVSGQEDHVDWMSFSSTTPPDAFDCNTFTGQNIGMGKNIRDRSLKNLTELEGYDVAGAMKWNLGDLEHGQKTSITLALMYGTSVKPPSPWILTKTADTNDCVDPLINNTINYTICYDANGHPDLNVFIVDKLPAEVNYYDSDPEGTYDPCTHTVTWHIPEMDSNDSNCFTLTVKVNYDADPGSNITNLVQMYGNEFSIYTSKKTCVDCWAGTALYVNADAPDDGRNRCSR